MGESGETSGEFPRRLGSFTTARVTAGRVERTERHAARLRRDAKRLGLPLPPRLEIEDLFREAAAAAFGRGDGIVRIEWSRPPGGGPELIPTPRPLGSVPRNWRAKISQTTHPGREFRANTKYVDVLAYDAGRREMRETGFDEVLLFDAHGLLVEGAHSNFLVVTRTGRLVTPDPALGAVEGLGLTIVLESQPEIAFARLRREDLESAREFMSVNAVRGVIPIIEWNGRPVANGKPGPWAERLRAPFTQPSD
ncbi:MAG: hypothetical protein CL933_18515 [Deltaproteobacteria bacterium]|nr:hypothetical protein [Deltaproteobacteria bacterium]